MSFWEIVWLVVAGAVLGVVAKLFLRGRQDIGFFWTVGAGIVGMLVGNWVADLLDVATTSGIDWIQHFLQVAAAVGAIALVVAFKRSRTSRPAA